MNIVIIGASSGIGREIAKKLASRPENRILAVARNENALKSLSDIAGNKNITWVHNDIVDLPKSARELKNHIRDEFETIDILINSAGYLVNRPFEEHTAEEVSALLNINFTGVAAIISELLPMLRKGAHVVNIGSMGGVQGSMKFPGLSYYSAAKGALAVLTECLAAEYKERGISFNCICPGAVETDMFRKAFPGHKAPVSASEMAEFIADFALTGNRLFNGKIIPVALSTP